MSQAHTTGKVLAGTVGAVGLLLATGQATNAASVTVKQNDTVWGLAQQHGVSIKSVEKLNAKALNGNSNLIFVGQQLQISGESSSSSAEKGTYTVKAGDTLWDLAAKHQMSVQSLQKLNGLSSDLIVVGQSLQVSGTKAATTTATTQSTTTSAAATTEKAASAASSTTSASTEVQDSVNTTSSSTSTATSASSVASTNSVATNESSSTLQTAYAPAASSHVTSSASETSSAASSQATSDSSTQVSSAASQEESTTATQTNSTASQSNTNNNVSQSSTSTASQANSSAATSSTTSAATSSASQASSTATTNNSSSASTSNNANLTSGSVTGLALQLAGANIPYVWGGNSLSGMDCSGLVAYVYLHAAGINLPHNTVQQEAYVTKHSVADAQPGDILFWGAAGATYHDAIYLGNNQFVAAPTERQNVKVESITSDFMPSFAGTVK